MTIDLTKRAIPAPAQVPVTPPAKPKSAVKTAKTVGRPALNMPLPAGQLITPKTLLPGEQKLLEQLGWQEGEPVPANLAAIAAQAREEATNLAQMPPPAPLTMPKLQVTETEFADLSPAEQQRTMEVLKSVLGQAKQSATRAKELAEAGNLDGSVLAALDIADDTDSGTYATGQPKTEAAPAVATPVAAAAPEQEADRCKRCGFPAGKEDPIVVTKEDEDRYFLSVISRQPFTKQYSLCKGKVRFTLRTLTLAEADLCWRQVSLDWKDQTVSNLLDHNEVLTRYRMALHLMDIEGLSTPVAIPKSLQEWEQLCLANPADDKKTIMTSILPAILSVIGESETLYRIVCDAVRDFNLLVQKLEKRAASPDF